MDAFDPVELEPLAPLAASSLAALGPPEPALLGPIVPGSIALVRGPRGVGKSWLALGIAHAVANGGGLLGWRGRRAPALYVETAMSGVLLGARLRELGPAADLRVICDERLDLTGEEDQARLLDALPEGGLLVIDGLAPVVRPGRAAWERFDAWIRMLRRAGHAVIVVDPVARPALAALADTLVTLKPGQVEADLGFAVEIASRHPLSAGDRAFVAGLSLDAGATTWTRTSLVPPELRAVIDAAHGGGTVRDIAAKLDLPITTAWRRLDKARALGLLAQTETGGKAEPVAPLEPCETGGTARADLAAVSTAVLKRTLARRAETPARAGETRPGPAILAGYDDAALAAECARRLKPEQAARLTARHAPALAAE
jgi:hypothetical protein